MKLPYILAALATFIAPAAAAQAFTDPPVESYLSLTKLNDGNNDGIINFTSRARGGIAKGEDARLCEDYPTPYLYVKVGVDCPTPVVVQPPEPNYPYAFLQTGKFSGPNVSGMEFKTELSIKTADLDLYIDQGATSLRIPFKFERIFASPAKLEAFKALILHGTERGVLMVADEHSYSVMGADRVRDGWLKLAPEFKGNPLVAFDLQNEPAGRTWTQWAEDTKTLVHTLRRNGVDNLFLVEWISSSGAYRADKREPETRACESALCALQRTGVNTLTDLDPLGRTWFSAHLYADKGNSGTNANCDASVSATGGLRGVFALGKAMGARVHLGETAFGRNSLLPSSCRAFSADLLNIIKTNPDLAGVNVWGGGPRWTHSYFYRVENPNNRPATWNTEHGKAVIETWKW